MTESDAAEPVNFLKYCPHCGSDKFKAIGPKEFSCGACGFNFFPNSAAAVVAVIRDDEGRILLTRRARAPKADWLDLPGGFVDPGEAAETALRREVKEELKSDIVDARYICSAPNEYIFSGYKVRTTDLAFECRLAKKPQECADDVKSIEWFRLSEIDLSQIAFKSIREIVSHVISGRKRFD